jgi:creatinine amidohydrolase
MQLQLCTWPEVEAYLKRSTGIIIPIGSTEQHGPNGFIGTDALCAEMVARRMGEGLGALVAPTVNVGMAQHHLGFPGSMTLRPTTLIAVIVDMVTSLAVHGFDRFFFVNGHGGNIATLSAAFSEIYAQASLGVAGPDRSPVQCGVRCRVQNWYHCDGVTAISKRRFGDAEGSHATPSEVSLTYFGHPRRGAEVKGAKMTKGCAPTGPILDAADYRRRFADGRIGSDPSLASVEVGEELLNAAVTEVSEAYTEFLAAD